MDTFLFTTPRLGFRLWRPSDNQPFRQINQDWRVMEHFPRPLTGPESDELAARIHRHFTHYGFGFYAVELLAENRFIGFIGFSHPSFRSHFTTPEAPCVEIGWRLSSDYWGRGLATEGARACIHYGFAQLGLREVFSFTASTNYRSERVMVKLGMKKIGEFDHPQVPKESLLRRHVLYYIEKNAYFQGNAERPPGKR